MVLIMSLSQQALPIWPNRHSNVPKGSKPCGSPILMLKSGNKMYYCVQLVRVPNMSLNPKHCICGFVPICSDTSSQTAKVAAASLGPYILWIFWYSLVKGWRTFSIFFPWQRVSLKSTSCQATAEGTHLDCVSDVIGYMTTMIIWCILK